MNITIINDCKDENAKGRQLARITSIFRCSANFIGVSHELEVAGNIIDILDANGDSDGIILVNVAPRNGKAKKYPNGTPFGYFWYKKTLIVSSIDGHTLSLVKKLKLTKFINVLDIPGALDILIKNKFLSPNLKNLITDSQFRSYNFLPMVAAFIFKNKKIKSKKVTIEIISDAPPAIWLVDNFGNCKTTIFTEELSLDPEGFIKTKFRKLKYYPKLKDVPDKSAAIITGSSGIGEKRFLEIVIQGNSATKKFNIVLGDNVFI